MPSISKPNDGGILAPNQISLTLDQRRLYDRLRSMGMNDLVARQLAVAVAKTEQGKPPATGLQLAKAAMQRVAVAKASYHENFVAAAKAALHPAMFENIHAQARARAGGHASGEARRAAKETADGNAEIPSVSVDKAEGASPPAGVRSACKRGLELAPEHGGDGLTDGAKARARAMANGESVSPENIKRMVSFFARHSSYEKEASPPSPGYVSWLLWGGDAGKSWAESQADKLEKGQKPLGAAFARAKATGKDQSKEARKRRANKYLKEQGHAPIGKGMGPLPQEFAQPEVIDPPKKKKKKKKKDDEAVTKGASPVPVTINTKIVKAEDKTWQQLVYSVVYEPDTYDTDGDYMDAETIEKAAHAAMAAGIYINSEHRGDPIGAHVVESYVAPCEMNLGGSAGDETVIKKGTWVMGMQVTDPNVWAGVLDGTYEGFSLEGSALAEVKQLVA